MQPRARSTDGFVKSTRRDPLRPQLRPMPIPRPQSIKPTPKQTLQGQPQQKTIAAARQPQPQPVANANTQPQPQRLTFEAPQQLQPRRRWWQRLAFPAIILLCLCASFLVQSLPLGMAAIAVYAVVAWFKKLPSRYSFVMAFLSLATVVVLLVVRQNVDLASNFSTYTFLLLVVGIVSVMLESKTYSKKRSSKILNLRRRKSL